MTREPEIICLDGEDAAKLCAGVLVDRSAWFEMTPLPDNKFELKFRSGEGHQQAIETCLGARLFRDFQGHMRKPPKDKPIIVADFEDGLIVWSRTKKGLHQVRYALQIKILSDDIQASEEFGHCVLHYATCEGRLP